MKLMHLTWKEQRVNNMQIDEEAYQYALMKNKGKTFSVESGDECFRYFLSCYEQAKQQPAITEEERRKVIEEVATQYHGALAEFWESEASQESLPGLAERHLKNAAPHRTYQKEIIAQVWLNNPAELKPYMNIKE